MAPRVSVLLPVRNAASTLEATLASLKAQTYADTEVIAVDDGSTDESHQFLLRASSKSPRLRVIRRAGAGIVAALNHAAQMATGDLLARMDADDVAYPERLARQVRLLDANPSVAACGTQVRYIPRRGLKDGARRYERWVNALVTPDDIDRELFVECPIPHPTLMVRRSAFEAIGGYRQGDFPEDYDLVFRLSSPASRLSKVQKVLLDWRDRPDRLSRTDPRYNPEAFRHLKVQYLRRLRLGARSVAVWGAGPVGKAFALELKRAGIPVVAFVERDPRKIGQEIHGAPVIAPHAVGEFREAYVVVAVGQVGAREEIRTTLMGMGRREVVDWCAVA